MLSTTGTNGVSAYEADLDQLYAWMPGPAPAPQACPEALFSCTLKGKLDGIETLLTVRGMTPEQFKRNLSMIRGLLDPPPTAAQPAAGQGDGWCKAHQVAMKLNDKDGRQWYSHKTADGWCKGRS